MATGRLLNIFNSHIPVQQSDLEININNRHCIICWSGFASGCAGGSAIPGPAFTGDGGRQKIRAFSGLYKKKGFPGAPAGPRIFAKALTAMKKLSTLFGLLHLFV
jgi:hypothetical protein